MPTKRPSLRHYKIQEVIKRRQILLVQVVKEERGNKGAALTTYLSLAGRYCVLMPNTARGGGISRKILQTADRKRLKTIVSSLEVPAGMGVIVRTAGASHTKEELERDLDYLLRLWESVRTLTLESTAPCLVYEEGSLIKRSIRDLFDKNIDEILVSGERGFEEAKEFISMLMPESAKCVKQYKGETPLFAKSGIEAQLDSTLSPKVELKSGGYLVINQTEALVAIDVNSGRATKQHSIEETAKQTNLEAAEEVSRQLRLRDLSGLIVIDFIDMDERRNNHAVERKLKDALKSDRARIQLGRISAFGLMEMSRQRLRVSVLEATTQICPTCEGMGHVKTPSRIASSILRAIEDDLTRNAKHELNVKTDSRHVLYLLNHKRDRLSQLEEKFDTSVNIEIDNDLPDAPYMIERGGLAQKKEKENGGRPDAIGPESAQLEIGGEDTGAEDASGEDSDTADSGAKRKKRTRSKSRKKKGTNAGGTSAKDADAADTSGEDTGAETAGDEAAGEAQDDAQGESEDDKKEGWWKRKFF